ncbi:hypothetical protein Tsubulata_014599 [Turnera subulata]|uniref:Uncharacterized protein n=1 Tax=Turnera subulata TaxID=218843 RepID=A0A9Q0G9N4_9ROSI|nr:hypothetical protein Tsubulata_014599 [Turnera subulata]
MGIFFPAFTVPRTLAYNALGALLFSSYVVVDTDRLIKRFDYDQYVSAAVLLYLDLINLFIKIIQILGAIANAKAKR